MIDVAEELMAEPYFRVVGFGGPQPYVPASNGAAQFVALIGKLNGAVVSGYLPGVHVFILQIVRSSGVADVTLCIHFVRCLHTQ